MLTPYPYAISTDFPNAAVAPSRLESEVRASAIVTALERIDTVGDTCTVWMKDPLSPGDEAILDGLVAAHSGAALPSEATLVSLDAPAETDKKPIVTISPATQGFLTWICGASDDLAPTPPASGRGDGPPFLLEFDASEVPITKTSEFQFSEPLELHDGQITWKEVSAWTALDMFSVGLRIPATVATPNGGGTGNANKVPLGPGMNLIVPAAGDGAFDVDLATACPVEDRQGMGGFWNVDYDSGVVAAGLPTVSRWNLFDFDIRAWLIRKVRMNHPFGVFDIDVYKTEYFHPSWRFVWEVTKASPGGGTVTGWIFAFRRHVD